MVDSGKSMAQSSIKFLKFGIPFGKAVEGVYQVAAMNPLQPDIDLMEEITQNFPTLTISELMKPIAAETDMEENIEAVGPALRALYNFLKQVDPNEVWSGLYKTPTPDGNILWLCEEHRREYQSRPLNLNT